MSKPKTRVGRGLFRITHKDGVPLAIEVWEIGDTYGYTSVSTDGRYQAAVPDRQDGDRMSNPKSGDRVRVTFEGEYTTSYNTEYVRGWSVPASSTFEILPPPLAPEPVVGTVVLDRHGVPFWRCPANSLWWASGASKSAEWADLNERYGPVAVIWTPEETP